jgi:trehalose-6-phosphatase
MAAPPEPDGIKHSAVFLDLDGTLLEIAEHTIGSPARWQ